MTIHCHFHLVITTKYRAKILNEDMNKITRLGFEQSIKSLGYDDKIEIVRCNFDNTTGKNDHVHILFTVKNFASIDLHAFVLGGKLHSRRAIRKWAQETNAFQLQNYDWAQTYYLKTVSPVGYDEAVFYIEHQNDEERRAARKLLNK